jgi:uncharacterized membrane protein YdfJ with MMPL/SSD domain
MKKRFLIVIALLIVAVPAALAAPPDGKKPKADAGAQRVESDSEKACRAERGTTAASIAAFAEKYGTNKNKKNAFGKCVSSKSKDEDDEDEAGEDKSKNKTNASKACKAERGTTAASIAAFAEKYGTNENKRNAFGKCVSQHAKEKDRPRKS